MSYLVKIGGSLIPSYVFKIYRTLRKLTEKSSQKIFLFPGGGEFADLIRKNRKTLSLSDETTHKMALACLDQNAYLIADMCKCDCVSNFRDIERVRKFPVVITPYRLIMESWPFSGYNLNIDILSSDSSAIYIAYLLHSKLIIATNVDGIYKKTSKKTKRKVKFLDEIDTEVLAKIKGGGPLDETLPGLIDKYKIETWVVNGKYPARIAQIIQNHTLLKRTLIKPKNNFQ